jgi:hypothetical protein
MSDGPSKRQVNMARMVSALVIILIIAGMIEYSHSPSERRELWHDILARPGGPMTFRFILQPVMAAIAAFRDAVKDARTGRLPYFLAVVTSKQERMGRLYEGLIATSQIILLGLVMDAIYQAIVLKTFYAGQAVLVALVLAFVPYLLLRGPISRLVRLWLGRKPAPAEPTNKTEP